MPLLLSALILIQVQRDGRSSPSRAEHFDYNITRDVTPVTLGHVMSRVGHVMSRSVTTRHVTPATCQLVIGAYSGWDEAGRDFA